MCYGLLLSYSLVVVAVAGVISAFTSGRVKLTPSLPADAPRI